MRSTRSGRASDQTALREFEAEGANNDRPGVCPRVLRIWNALQSKRRRKAETHGRCCLPAIVSEGRASSKAVPPRFEFRADHARSMRDTTTISPFFPPQSTTSLLLCMESHAACEFKCTDQNETRLTRMTCLPGSRRCRSMIRGIHTDSNLNHMGSLGRSAVMTTGTGSG